MADAFGSPSVAKGNQENQACLAPSVAASRLALLAAESATGKPSLLGFEISSERQRMGSEKKAVIQSLRDAVMRLAMGEGKHRDAFNLSPNFL